MLLLYTGLAMVLGVLGTGGEVGRLFEVRLHRVRPLLAGVALHLLVSHWRPTGGFGRGVGFLLVLVSIGLIVRFVAANLALTNMSIVLVGLGLNALCVLVNGGMPVALAPSADRAPYEHSLTHHPQRGDDHITLLADHLRLPGPDHTPVSYGDLVLAFGLVGVGYRLGTDRRGAHAARPNATPMIEVPDDEPLFAEVVDHTPPPPTREPEPAAVVESPPRVPEPEPEPEPAPVAVVSVPVAVEPAEIRAEDIAAAPPVLAEEPLEALLVDEPDDEPEPEPEIATEPEPEPEPEVAAVPPVRVPAIQWPTFSPRLRRHRRSPRPDRIRRIGLHLFAPVPLEPEDLADPWWTEPEPLPAELVGPGAGPGPSRP